MFQSEHIKRCSIKIFLITTLPFLFGCQPQEVSTLDHYLPVTISNMKNNHGQFLGKKIAVEGYILGSEFHKDPDIGQIWIMVIADQPLKETRPDHLIFPQIKNKIRVVEEGFNKDIIVRCYQICHDLSKSGRLIKVYGTYQPSQTIGYYSGVDLHLSAVEIDGTIFNTDYDDHGRFKEKTPSVLKKIIKGGKGLVKIIKVAI